jgi:hypothetical protein
MRSAVTLGAVIACAALVLQPNPVAAQNVQPDSKQQAVTAPAQALKEQA